MKYCWAISELFILVLEGFFCTTEAIYNLKTLRLQFVVVCKSGNAAECITNIVVTNLFFNLIKSCLILEWKTSMSRIKKVHKEDTEYVVEEIWKVDDNWDLTYWE